MKLTPTQQILHCYATNRVFGYSGLADIFETIKFYDPQTDLWEDIEFFIVFAQDLKFIPTRWAFKWHDTVEWDKPNPSACLVSYFKCECIYLKD